VAKARSLASGIIARKVKTKIRVYWSGMAKFNAQDIGIKTRSTFR
jgi:hypothetical protein